MEFTQEELANEIWKPVVGFPNYEVSNLGRVKGLNYANKGKPNILKPKKKRYPTVSLRLNKKDTYIRIHRLVATAFIPNPENKRCIDHINCNPKDNRVENLRWATQKENMQNPLTKEKCRNSAIGRKASVETKEKLRLLHSGANNGFYGKTHSEDSINKMKQALLTEDFYRKNCKPILQISKDGTERKEWISINLAVKDMGCKRECIASVLRGKKLTYKGYIWKYADNPDEIFDRYFAEKKKK